MNLYSPPTEYIFVIVLRNIPHSYSKLSLTYQIVAKYWSIATRKERCLSCTIDSNLIKKHLNKSIHSAEPIYKTRKENLLGSNFVCAPSTENY